MSHCEIGNAWGALPAWYTRNQAEKAASPLLLIVPGASEAQDAVQDLETFGLREPILYPEVEILDAPSRVRLSDRLQAILRASPGRVLVASIRAALEPAPSPRNAERLLLRRRRPLDRGPLIRRLLDLGYERVPAVDSQGEFAVRGGILDLFPLGHDFPVRIEFDGNTIESLRLFHVEDQRSFEPVNQLQVLLTDNPLAEITEEAPDLLDALPDAAVFLQDPAGMEDHVRRFYDRPAVWRSRKARFFARARQRPGATFSPLPGAGECLPAAPPPRFEGTLGTLPRDLQRASEAYTEIRVYASDAERKRLRDLLRDAGLALPNLRIVRGRLSRGFTLKGIAHVPHHELFRRRPLPPRPRGRPFRPLESILELHPGDYVVHKHYGIGRFSGIERVRTPGREYDAVVLTYQDNAKLYVPAGDLSLVQKYVAPADAPVALSSLRTRSWTRARREAAQAAEKLARQLVQIQARRKLLGGYAFPPDDDLQRLFEASFPYEETPDQQAAMEQIKRDLGEPRASDRLLCGDVGFGKTELAMRAAFKAVTAGRQVAVLCPTTVLAQQHFHTFRDRMAEYPVKIEVLSRFRSRREQTAILKRLASGEIDILIGTHRLVQPDVRFKDLGLVIIDEEQRFGVEHKEALKRLRQTVDVLTLTATPIPRTLHLALLTIRDITVLSTAPRERLAVQTSVVPRNRDCIREAIRFELERRGQVYFVHNRVHTIRKAADEVRELVPEARLDIAHGRMPSGELEETMLRFVEGETDVLVATSIIENGLDIPNANTIIIDDAHRFGLSDLHQLRGRVGRHDRQAYAILLIPPRRPLTPEARRRLQAIEELSDLGAGFQIAMRDMEIRGVGNILGKEQHGHIRKVGYELYVELLEKEIRRLQGKPARETPHVSARLSVPAFVPESYVPDPGTRVEFYRRLGRARTMKEIEALRESTRDRFGPIPRPVETLFMLQRLKAAMAEWRMLSVTETAGFYVIKYADRDRAGRMQAADPESVRIVDEGTIYVPTRVGPEGLLQLFSGERVPRR